MTQTDDFFGEGYEMPIAPSKYAKIEQDKELRIRILEKPLVGWIYFSADKKVHRQKKAFEECVNPSISKFNWKPNPQKEFWAFKVYNVNTKCIEIFEIDKQTVKEKMMDLYIDADYGNLTWYDLKIKKEWEWTDTTYKVLPWPVTPISHEVEALGNDTYVNLEALFKWEDPFENPLIEELPGDKK